MIPEHGPNDSGNSTNAPVGSNEAAKSREAKKVSQSGLLIQMAFNPAFRSEESSLWKNFFLPFNSEMPSLEQLLPKHASEDDALIAWYAQFVGRISNFMQQALKSSSPLDVLAKRVHFFVKQNKFEWLAEWKKIHTEWQESSASITEKAKILAADKKAKAIGLKRTANQLDQIQTKTAAASTDTNSEIAKSMAIEKRRLALLKRVENENKWQTSEAISEALDKNLTSLDISSSKLLEDFKQ